MLSVVAYAILFPALAAGLVWLISWPVWKRRNAGTPGHNGGAAALTAGYITAYAVIMSWPPFPPVSASQRMFYLAIVIGFIGLGEAWWTRHIATRLTMRLCATALTAGYLLHPLFRHTWGPIEGFLWLAGLTAATVITWASLEKLSERRSGMTLPLALWLTCALGAGSLALAGSTFLGQLAGALAAVFGVAAVIAFWVPGFSLSSGAVTAFVLLFSGLLWQGLFFAELPLASGPFLLLAPLAAWVGELPPLAHRPHWKATALPLAAVALTAAIGLAIAVAVFLSTPAADYSY